MWFSNNGSGKKKKEKKMSPEQTQRMLELHRRTKDAKESVTERFRRVLEKVRKAHKKLDEEAQEECDGSGI